MRKNLDLNLRPEKQHTLPKQGSLERPHAGQGRAGSKRKNLIPSIMQSTNHQTCHRKFLEEPK